MPAPEVFTTERLVARRVRAADEPFVAAMYQDPDVKATLGSPRDAEQVHRLVARMIDHWDRRGFGVWILRDRVTVASQRTMRGLGFVDAGSVEHAGLPHVLTRRRLDHEEVAERG